MFLRTLGELVLEGCAFRRHRPLLLLAYLATEGPKTRRELADLFFFESKDPRDALSTTLSRLQRGASGSIKPESTRLVATVPCDALELQAALDNGRPDQAVALYAGPFLQGIDVALGEELEEWVFAVREHLAARVREAHLKLGENAAARGEGTTAARHAEAALTLTGAPELEPEGLSRLYALLCVGGSPKAAGVKREAESYGLELHAPLPELVGRPSGQSPWVPGPNNLSALATSFVGRETELLDIDTLLSEPHGRLLTLHGPGGVGKTKLALQAAHQQLEKGHFKDGVFFVGLEALTSAEQVPLAVAEAMKLSLQGTAAPLEQLKDHLWHKRLLLVLDNYEHLMDAASLPAELLAACPHVCLLVTSRERLNLQEEQVLSLEGLPLPAEDTALKDAEHVDALHLFVHRAKRAKLDTRLTEDNLPYASKICRLVQGSPLGIELAAAWTHVMPLAEIASEIERNLDFLTSTTRNVPGRQQSVRATFAYSWWLLKPREQEVLRKLAVFHGGFRREGASKVAGATIPVLASLVDKSLLRVSPAGRFDRHPLLHAFMEEKLSEHPAEEAEARRKHAHYVFRVFEQLDDHQASGTVGPVARQLVDEELDNLRAAWRWATDHEPPLLQASVTTMWRYFITQPRCVEGYEMASDAITRLDQQDPAQRGALGAAFLLQAGGSWWMARYREGYEQAERGLALMRALKDERGIGLGLSMLGGNAWRMGDFLRAKACYKEELAIARKLEHRVPRALQNLAHAEHALGNFKRAEELLAEAAALDRRDGKLDYLAGDLANLARVAANQGNFSQAQALIDEAFELQAQVGERAFLGMTVAARIAMQRKDHARARELSERALGYFQQAGNLSHQVEVSLLLARTATAQGNYAKAQRHIGVGLNHAHATRARPLVFMSLLEVAHLRAATGQPEEAAPLLSLIAHHPTAEAIVKLEAKGLLEQITAALPADVIAEAIEQGRGLTPEEALDGMLRDKVSSGCAADARSDVPGNDFRFGADVTDEG